MKINIYYGGRGVIGDPTLFVIDKMQEVFSELNVTVERYNLYELKNELTTLPQSLKDADGIILATTVEWYGIGGYMQQFLDACWLYGDKEKIAKIYMCPIAMSTTYGEREAKLNLSVAWEHLGGIPCSGISGYIQDVSILEQSEQYARLIEKKAESMYRSINQKLPVMPCSNQAVRQKVSFTQNMNLTPQEAEQLSQYVSDDKYVRQQKEDIQELANMFKDLLGEKEQVETLAYVDDLKSKCHVQAGIEAVYRFLITGNATPLILKIENNQVDSYYGQADRVDVELQVTTEVMDEIVMGHMTFQRAFMAGAMKMKGDFKLLRALDVLYDFSNAS